MGICHRCQQYEKHIMDLYQTIERFRKHNDVLLHKCSDAQEQIVFHEQKIIDRCKSGMDYWFCKYGLEFFKENNKLETLFVRHFGQFIQNFLRNENNTIEIAPPLCEKRKWEQMEESDNTNQNEDNDHVRINKKNKINNNFFDPHKNNNRKREREYSGPCSIDYYKKMKMNSNEINYKNPIFTKT